MGFFSYKEAEPSLVLHDEPTVVEDDNEDIFDPSCAWCLGERGITPMSGSHDVCVVHAELLLAKHQFSKVPSYVGEPEKYAKYKQKQFAQAQRKRR